MWAWPRRKKKGVNEETDEYIKKIYELTMHLGELAEWCLKNCIMPEDTEENRDKPFVVCYKVKIDDEEPMVWPVEPQVE